MASIATDESQQDWVTLRRLAIPLLVSASLGYLYFNFIQNSFFTGAYVDLGTWAHLAYGPTAFNQDAFAHYPSLLDYFRIHFRPIFVLLSAPSAVLPVNLIDNISLIFAAVAVLISTSGAVAVLALRLPLPPFVEGLLAAATGLAFYLSAPNLAALGYPHFEALFAPLTALFFVFYATRHRVWSAVALALLLTVREDMGLHFGVFTLSFAAFEVLIEKVTWRKVRFLVAAGALALGYSVLARLTQMHFFPGGHVLVGDYLGDPIYAHVTQDFVARRLSAFWEKRGYIVFAFLATLALAAYYRRPQYLLGHVIFTPWLVFNLLAVKATAGDLSTYRMYPFTLALIWPVVYEALRANCLYAVNQDDPPHKAESRWTKSAKERLGVVLAVVIICASTTLISSPTRSPVKHVKPANSGVRDATVLLQTFLGQDQHHRFDLRLTPSVAAVGSNEIKRSDVIPRDPGVDISGAKGVIFYAGARDACRAIRFASEGQFDRIAGLGKSPIFVAFQSEKDSELVDALRNISTQRLDISEADFPESVLYLFHKCKF